MKTDSDDQWLVNLIEFNRKMIKVGVQMALPLTGSINRPKVAICPHKLDYCDTCAKFNEDIHANQTTLNRLKQTGSSSEEELKSLESDIQELQSAREVHKQTAQNSHKYHLDMVKRCSTQWEQIQELQGQSTLSAEEEEQLTRLHNIFTLTLSADFQMSKLIPSWGVSPQPGSTYYLQKLQCKL